MKELQQLLKKFSDIPNFARYRPKSSNISCKRKMRWY